MRHHTALRSAALLLTAAILGCGGGGGGDATSPTSTTPTTPATPAPASGAVSVLGASFAPSDLTVGTNTAVTWTWNSCTGGDGYGSVGTCVAHNVVFDDGAPGSGTMDNGTFSRTFTAPGTYPYHCAIHGAAMSGRVVVQ